MRDAETAAELQYTGNVGQKYAATKAIEKVKAKVCGFYAYEPESYEGDSIFTARRYAKRGIYRRRVSVSVGVCPSHSGIVSKRLNVGSRKQRRTIAPWL